MTFAQRLKQLAAGATERPFQVFEDASFSGSEDFPFDIRLAYGVDPCTPNVMACRMSKRNAEFFCYLANNATAIAAAIELFEDLIDVCDGNYKELTDECRAAVAQLKD